MGDRTGAMGTKEGRAMRKKTRPPELRIEEDSRGRWAKPLATFP